MKQRWTEEELVEFWTLSHAEQQLLSQRTERGRLNYAAFIKFFQLEGRFPLYNKEVPTIAIEFLAEQLTLSASLWLDISLDSRSSERARAEIRAFLGFRVATVEDSHQIQAWLSNEVVTDDQEPRHLKAAVLDWCRKNRIEPPTPDRVDRIVQAAIRQFEQHFFNTIHGKLSLHHQQQLDALLTATVLGYL